MKKNYGSLLIFFLVFHCCISQNNRFVIDYGSFPNAQVDVTASGYVLAGTYNSGMHFARTDISGNVVLSTAKSYVGTGIGDFRDMRRLADKGYILLAGNSIVRTDS